MRQELLRGVDADPVQVGADRLGAALQDLPDRHLDLRVGAEQDRVGADAVHLHRREDRHEAAQHCLHVLRPELVELDPLAEQSVRAQAAGCYLEEVAGEQAGGPRDPGVGRLRDDHVVGGVAHQQVVASVVHHQAHARIVERRLALRVEEAAAGDDRRLELQAVDVAHRMAEDRSERHAASQSDHQHVVALVRQEQRQLADQHLRRQVALREGAAARDRLRQIGRHRRVRLAVHHQCQGLGGAEDRYGAGQPLVEEQDVAVAPAHEIEEGGAIQSAVPVGVAENAARHHIGAPGRGRDEQVAQEQHHEQRQHQALGARHDTRPQRGQSQQGQERVDRDAGEEYVAAADGGDEPEPGQDRSDDGARRVPGVGAGDQSLRAGPGKPQPAEGQREHRPQSDGRQDHHPRRHHQLDPQQHAGARVQAVVQQVIEVRQLAGDEQSQEDRHRHEELAERHRDDRIGRLAQQPRTQAGANRQADQEGGQHHGVRIGRRA